MFCLMYLTYLAYLMVERLGQKALVFQSTVNEAAAVILTAMGITHIDVWLSMNLCQQPPGLDSLVLPV